MFGVMNVIPIADLRHAPEEVGGTIDGAIARLLDVTEHPRIEKWVQFPKALFVFLVVPADPESGAFYIYDRRARVWFWLDFDDEKFGGYSVSDFDCLVRECRFLDIVECPELFPNQYRWVIQPGLRPRQNGKAAELGVKKPA
jgi:hypothetical protein